MLSYTRAMMQLSLVGPPEAPESAPSRYRLRNKIRSAVLMRLSAHGIDSTIADDITDAIVDGLSPKPPTIDTRTLILRMCDFRPVCWVCGFSIDLNEPEDTPGSFSLDHVVPRSAGGSRLGLANLKPAHRFCNNIRSQRSVRRSTRVRYEGFVGALAGLQKPIG
jgi:5-methylcytosine-specific restriction endonuclease McrA